MNVYTFLSTGFEWALRASGEASLVAALVLAVHLVLGRRMSARRRFNLWLLVVLRLALPVVPETRWSPFNWLGAGPTAAAVALYEAPAGRTARPGAAAGEDALSLPPVASTIGEGESAWQWTITSSPAASVPSLEKPAVTIAPAGRAPATPAVVTATVPVPWRTWLAAGWLLGVAFVIARLICATAAVRRVVRRATPVEDLALQALLRACADALGVKNPPAALRAAPCDNFGPALVGALRPRLVLPAAVLDGFSRSELRLVLLHELAHQRRRDVALNWVCSLVGALHWFNPVVRLALRRMRADRELACDELALRAGGPGAAAGYGPVLIKMLEVLSGGPASRPPASAGAVGVLDAGAASFRKRITMIAQFDGNPTRRPLLAAAASVLIGGVALTGAVRGGAGAPGAEQSSSKAVEAPAALPTSPGPENGPGSKDTVIGARDLLQITVYDLEGPGLQTIKNTRVNSAGGAAAPDLAGVPAAGLTERQFAAALAEAYRARGRTVSNVSVVVAERKSDAIRPRPDVALFEVAAEKEALRSELLRLVERRQELVKVGGDQQAEVLRLDEQAGEITRELERLQAAVEESKRAQDRAAEEKAKQLKRGTIAADELVSISIMDLAGPGIETVKTTRVDPDGNVNLPFVGAIKAFDLRPAELERAVAKAYQEKKVLAGAFVAVSLPSRGESHQLTARPGAADRGVAKGVEPAAAAPDPAAETEFVSYDVADLLGGAADGPQHEAQVAKVMEVIKIGAGADASVTSFGSKIIVSARRRDHQGIQAVLGALRERPATTPATRPK